MTLIRSSIYRVSGKIVRYTGEGLTFRAHGETVVAKSMRNVRKASKQDIATYFGK